MKISDKIMRIIGEAEFIVAPVTTTSNLYADLGYDSLSFVRLLLKIEEAFSIRFDLPEMGTCIRTDRLIALVEQKVKKAEYD